MKSLFGILKVLLLIGLDLYAVFKLSGSYEISFIFGLIFLIASLIGESIEVWQKGGVRIGNCPRNLYDKVNSSINIVSEKTGLSADNFIFYIIPTDELNAYSFGAKKIGICSGLINTFDENIIAAVIAHEISHTLNLDSIVKRIITINIWILLLAVSLASTLCTILLWIIIGLFAVFTPKSGFISVCVAKGISNMLHKQCSSIQNICFGIYSALLGCMSRGMEYRADKFVVDNGIGEDLADFLQVISDIEPITPHRTISEILYDSHPPVLKRISAIEKRIDTSSRTILSIDK